MKTVVNIINGVPVKMQVESDWIRCSVTGEYRPPSEFSSNGVSQTRTNCTASCDMPSSSRAETKNKTAEVFRSREFISIQKEIDDEWAMGDSSILAHEMIDRLRKLIETEGEDARVCMTQDGYYASGGFANIGSIERVSKDTSSMKVFSIGHSSQNC